MLKKRDKKLEWNEVMRIGRKRTHNEHTRTWYKRLLTEWSTKHNFSLLDQFITAVKSLHTHLHLAAPLLLLPHHLLRNIIRLMHYCKSISWIDWGHCGVAHKSQPTAVWLVRFGFCIYRYRNLFTEVRHTVSLECTVTNTWYVSCLYVLPMCTSSACRL